MTEVFVKEELEDEEKDDEGSGEVVYFVYFEFQSPFSFPRLMWQTLKVLWSR